jgi:CheY-like chemotaxis protein
VPRILVVEDERPIRTLISLALKHEGYHVTEAEDGLEALEALRRDPPDLMLLDLRLPRLTGIELIQHLCSDGGIPCPVVVMTAYTLSPADRQVLTDLPLVRKPFDPEDLQRLVRETLHTRREQPRPA